MNTGIDNDSNFTGIRMYKNDYLALPPEMRQMGIGPFVLSRKGGRSTFVRVLIIDC